MKVATIKTYETKLYIIIHFILPTVYCLLHPLWTNLPFSCFILLLLHSKECLSTQGVLTNTMAKAHKSAGFDHMLHTKLELPATTNKRPTAL